MNIHLRALQDKDAEGMLEWMTEPSIIRFFQFDATNMTIYSCHEFIAVANRNPECIHYAIADEEDDYLGTISLKNINTDKKTAEYAISTRSCAHGTGAAMQATKELLNIAFEELHLESVYLNVLVENVRANAFYKKVGFRYERCENHAINIRNEWKDLNWYAINRDDFLREQKNGK